MRLDEKGPIIAMSEDELEEEIRHHNNLYWNLNQQEVSDEHYDFMVEALRRLNEDNPVLREMGARVGPRKVKHLAPMLSLKKAYTAVEVEKWARGQIGAVWASHKADGLACSIRYDANGHLSVAATRGNGEVGDDVTGNIYMVRDVPTMFRPGAEVRGEVYLQISTFQERYADEYSNPRNLAAGALKQKDPAKTEGYGLRFLAYDLRCEESFPSPKVRDMVLRDAGFQTVPGREAAIGRIGDTIAQLVAEAKELDFETDGIVIRVPDDQVYAKLGATGHHPRGAIAFKYQGDSAQTTLAGIEWEVSRTGTMNPVAVVAGVELSGAVITRASLHNLSIMEELGGTELHLGANPNCALSPGATVLVTRRGGVIPHIESVIEAGSGVVVVPRFCYSCVGEVTRVGDFLRCDHEPDCTAKGVPLLEHFVKVVDIQGFGPKVLSQLWEEGLVRFPYQLFTLEADQFEHLERMGEKKCKRLVGEVQAHRRIPLRTFLRSLAIPELGNKISRDLEAAYADCPDPLQSIRDMTIEEMQGMDNVGPAISKEVVNGLRRSRQLIDNLLAYVEVFVEAENVIEQESNVLSGKSFLFTGAMESMKRSDGQGLVKEHGGVVASSVTASLDFLVLGDKDYPKYQEGWRSSKLKKAEKAMAAGAALRIISEGDFLRMAAP